MWMLRGKLNRWGPGLAERATGDLRLDSDGLSLFLVTGKEDAKSIAASFVLVFKEESRHDWILLSDSCLAPFSVTPDPHPSLPSPLRERHHLVKNTSREDLLTIARLACEDTTLDSFRQNLPDILALAPALLQQYNLTVTEYWRKHLS
jgi:hypothetical protein